MKETKEKNETRTYTFPRTMVKQLQNEARETIRTESEMIRYIVKKHYENKKEKE